MTDIERLITEATVRRDALARSDVSIEVPSGGFTIPGTPPTLPSRGLITRWASELARLQSWSIELRDALVSEQGWSFSDAEEAVIDMLTLPQHTTSDAELATEWENRREKAAEVGS